MVDLVDTFTWEKLLSLPTGTAWAHSLAFSPTAWHWRSAPTIKP